MINRLEGYTGSGFEERRAYINLHNGLNVKKDSKQKMKSSLPENNQLNNQNNRINEIKKFENEKIRSEINSKFKSNINH